MDERGFTVDPYRGALEPTRWWEKIGASQKPSPYSTASWVCVQTTVKELTTVLVPGTDPPIGTEATHVFVTATVYDRKASDPAAEPDEYPDDTDSMVVGTMNYEIFGSVMTITDWDHHTWYNSRPIEFAFKAVITNRPECVKTIIVAKPEAFWKSLGFVHPSKEADVLVYDTSIGAPVPY
jgi:hypothetical protein